MKKYAGFTRQFLFFICSILLSVSLFHVPAAAGNSKIEKPYHVLYISSYSYSWGTVPFQIAGIDRAFSGIEYVVNYEFMDTKNTEYSEGYREFYDFLKYKMKSRYPYDGVVVGDDAALNFVQLYREDLFAGIPISFLAVDNVENGEEAAKDPLISGVVEQVDYGKNIEIAKKLLPGGTKLTFIMDNKENGVGIAKQLEKQKELFKDYEVAYLNSSEYTYEELCKKLSSFTEKDIVFFVSMGQQKNNVILTENERYQMIRQYASVPLFRLTPAGVGNGALGGYVVDFEQSGYLAGKIIIDMLKHPEKEAPAMIYDTPGMYYFDYNILHKYHLSQRQLPEGTTVLNVPESFWRTYSNVIIISMLLVLLTAFAIFIISIKKAQRKMELQNAELKKANNAKTTFLSTMSHDIRTPLNAIINMAALAHDDIGQAQKITSDLDTIGISGSFLLGLINDVLDMSKIESGKMTLQPGVYHYADFINYVDGIIVPLCRDKDIQFVWEKGKTAVPLWVDRTRFNQLFFNLLSNAVKYTNSGGTVTFMVKNNRIENQILICDYIVADNGIGISEEFQQKMFLPFEREEQSEAYTGTGLGLTIAKQIVDLMKGTIDVKSKLGEGSVFTVHLAVPLATKEQIAAVAKSAPDLTAMKQKKEWQRGRILVVEDHPLNREIMQRLLKREHYQVECVENGKEAVEKIEICPSWYYQTILMDIRMPVMDGLSATREIRKLPLSYAKEVPIVAMTANAYDEDAKKSMEAGMNAHLSKPVEPDKLYQTLAMYAR